MNGQARPLRSVLWVAAALAAAPACHDSMYVVAPDAGADGDGDADADGDADTDADTDPEDAWVGVGIADVSAPDEHTVVVGFTGEPPAAEAAAAGIYSFTSAVGPLAAESVTYDAAERVATIATARQKLGITYTLAITPPAEGATPLAADFLSADTAELWVVDFAGNQYEQRTFERGAVGETGVAYVEAGHFADAGWAAANFDANVYPVETSLFCDAPDMDGNGKILILGLDGGDYYGGYFDPINTYTEEQLIEWGYAEYGYHSNEMEIIHINVAWGEFDPGGTVVAHEFQHLLYQEAHPNNEWLDTYHNEGLSECAVRAVNGSYAQAVDYYFGDWNGMIGAGLSLVDWGYAIYENYVLAFMFWSYVAAQLDGVDTYAEIFDLETGAPDVVAEFLLDNLGTDFGQTQLNQMLAAYVQDDSGPHSYEGFLDLGGMLPPHVAPGTSSVNLEPYAGTFFRLGQESVDYPGTQGEHVVYAGIDGDGAVDLAAPFAVGGGALAVLNADLYVTHESYPDPYYPTEHSGPDVAAIGGKAPSPLPATVEIPPAWTDPPPAIFLSPARRAAWRATREAQIAAQ